MPSRRFDVSRLRVQLWVRRARGQFVKLNKPYYFIVRRTRCPALGSAGGHCMPERMMKPSHNRLLQWPAHLSLTRRGYTTELKNGRRGSVDHDAIRVFHALIPALLLSLLLWCLLLLLF